MVSGVKLSKSTDGVVSRYINRKISIRITLAIAKYNIPLTPNMVSFISFILGLMASLLYFIYQPIIAGIMVQVSSIIDGVDGELARIKRMESRFGGFLDAILDRIVDIAIILGLTSYSLYTCNLPPLMVSIVGMLALSGCLMVSYVHARGEASLKIHPALIGKVSGIASRDVRLFLIFIGSIINYPFETLLIIAILSYIYVVLKIIEVSLHYREDRKR